MSKQDPSVEYAIGVLSDGTVVKTDDVAKMPMGIKYAVNPSGMSSWQTAFITQLYNKYADKPVKKFKDKDTAAKRTFELLSENNVEVELDGEILEGTPNKIDVMPGAINFIIQ